MTILLLSIKEFIKTLASNLWSSTSSIKFYQNVFLHYRGYGIKYIFTLSLISSLLCSAVFLYNANQIKNYLANNSMSSEYVETIDYVIRQLPVLDYDGNSINKEQDKVIFINNANNNITLAIDVLNQLPYKENVKIPILLLKDKMRVSFFNNQGKLLNSFFIKYKEIFGTEPSTITQDKLKEYLLTIFEKTQRIIVYIIFPIIAGLIFFNTLLENSVMILMIFVFLKISNRQPVSFRDCIRVVLFSSGFYTLFDFILLLGFIELRYILWGIQILATILMFTGIIRSNKIEQPYRF